MGTQTSKLKLEKPYESDMASIGVINANMEKIDALTHITASGTATSSKYHNQTDSPNGSVTWRYKKFDDSTFSANCKFSLTDLMCNTASGQAYWSGYIRVMTPNIGISSVDDCQVHVAGNCFNWIINITGATILDYVQFRCGSVYQETEEIYKQFFIHIEGRWS